MILSEPIMIFLNNSNILLAAILCFLPVYQKIRFPKLPLFVFTGVLLTGLLFLMAFLYHTFRISENIVMFLSFVPLFFLYYRSVNINFYKALSVFLVTVSLFCFPAYYTYIFSAFLNPLGTYTDYSAEAVFFLLGISALFFLALFYPFMRCFSWMIENFDVPGVWKAIILWAILCISLMNLMIPMQYSTLHTNRTFYVIIVLVTFLLFAILFLYYTLYRMARSTYEISRLARQNQLLGFQASQYQTLVSHMENTRRQRHDFRQQLLVINGLLQQKKYDDLKEYLGNYVRSTEEEAAFFTDNAAVNSLVSYYDQIAKEDQIPVSWTLNLPSRLPLPESEFCAMLGNLLENSITASMELPIDKRSLKVIAHMPKDTLLVLMVENTYCNSIRQKGEIFYSTSHLGEGIGIASVRELVQRYHGHLDISHDDGLFAVHLLISP